MGTVELECVGRLLRMGAILCGDETGRNRRPNTERGRGRGRD